MDIKGWIKAHPYSTGALVIGGGVVFIMLSGVLKGGGSTVAVSSSGVSDAQLAAQTQVQLAQIAAGATNQQTNAELSAAGLAASVQAKLAEFTATTEMYKAAADKEVNLAYIGAQTAFQQQNLTTQSQMFTVQNQTALEAAKLDAAVNVTNITANKDVALAQINSTNATTQAIIQALTPKTPTVVAPKQNVWDAVLADRPDVDAAWTSTAQYNPKYSGNEKAWVQDWYTQWGATSGYQLPQI